MRSPERCRTAAALCLALGVAVAGCATQADTASPQPTATEVTGVPGSSAPEQAEAPSTSSDGTAPGRTPAAGDDGPPATVAVDGGELPEALVEGYARNGGDLVDPAEWSGRFGRSALPELTGPASSSWKGSGAWNWSTAAGCRPTKRAGWP